MSGKKNLNVQYTAVIQTGKSHEVHTDDRYHDHANDGSCDDRPNNGAFYVNQNRGVKGYERKTGGRR